MDTKYYMSHESNFDIVLMDLQILWYMHISATKVKLYCMHHIQKPGHILILGEEILTVNHAWFEANII